MSGDWVTAPLEDVCDIEYGTRVVKKRDAGILYPVYGGGGATFFVDRYNREDCTIVSRFAMSKDCVRHVDGRFFLNDSGLSVAPKEQQRLTKWFLNYFLLANSSKIYSLGRGAAQKNLDVKMFRKILVSFPRELDEQKRIVAMLDEAFAGIEATIANTEKSLANAHELAEITLEKIITGVATSEMVLAKAVAEDCSLSYGIVQPGSETEGGLPVVRPVDLDKPTITSSGLKRIDPERASSYQRTRLNGCELLLCVRGTTGTVAQASETLSGANVTRGIVPIRFAEDLVDQRFGYYLLRSGHVQSQIREKTYGAALMQINIRDLRKINLHVPALDKQKEMVTVLRQLEDNLNSLQDIYLQKLSSLEELKQSLLQKAFSGELTAKQVGDAAEGAAA